MSQRNHPPEPEDWAKALGVPTEAAALLIDADFLDLHQTTELPARLLCYDPAKRHTPRTWPQPWLGHCDFPRLNEGAYTGVFYDITTNPLRNAQSSLEVTGRNIERALERLRAADGVTFVNSRAGYTAASLKGDVAAFISLQGCDCLAADPTVLDGQIGQSLSRVTLVHMTTSRLGGTSSPFGKGAGITDLGRTVIEACNRNGVILDLSHASKPTFWGAIEAHRHGLPPIVSHTGLSGVHKSWRNIDDDQLKAIADRGGVVGIIYHGPYLEPVWTFGSRAAIVRHIDHVVRTVGDDFVALGSDYDGMIHPPKDMPDLTHHPLLVHDMLELGYSEQRIRKILGLNALRVIEAVCG